jgi:hypothetical protein
MKPLSLLIALTFNYFLVNAQNLYKEENNLPKELLQVNIGKSIHYSGDMDGYIFHSSYSKYTSKRSSWAVGIGGSTHHRTLLNFIELPSGKIIDGSLRMTTSGIQAYGHYGYSFIRTIRHELKIEGGFMFRYQSRSNMDEVYLWYPLITNWDVPVWEVYNNTPQNTFLPGLNFQLGYNYTLSEKLLLGLLTGYQFDGSENKIAHLSLSVGKRF